MKPNALSTVSKKQSALLRESARKHEQLGNVLLAKWLRDSAEHYAKIERDTDKYLDSRNSHSREDRTVGVRNDRERFAHQWFKYEEEYEANFSMD